MAEFSTYVKLLLLVGVFITTGLIGSTRRLGFVLTFLISLVLTPIGGFLAALISGPKRRKASRKRSSS